MRSTDRAARLMQQFGVDDSLIGDVLEQCRAGRSAVWLWRQTIIAVAQQIVSGVQQHPLQVAARTWESVWLATGAVAMSLSLSYVWMHLIWRYVVILDVAWYPSAMNWMARSSPPVIWQLFVLLHPWAWTWTVAWCAVLCANRVVSRSRQTPSARPDIDASGRVADRSMSTFSQALIHRLVARAGQRDLDFQFRPVRGLCVCCDAAQHCRRWPPGRQSAVRSR